MSKPKSRILPMLAALATMSFTVPAFAQPQVTPLSVTPGAPESVRLDVTGLSYGTVRPQVHSAARLVCRNAVTNRDISFTDEDWCSDAAFYKAMRQFDAIVSHRTFADSGMIVLSAR